MHPKLTIGMATFDDFDGVYFSVQALRLLHADVMPEAEILIVDNHPDSSHGRMTGQFAASITGDVFTSRYIPFTEVTGTAAPRDRIFREATGEVVLCMDSHVLIAPGALRRLLAWCQEHPSSRDLLSGPMLNDNLRTYATHFDDVWRGEMWGIWGTAWACPCGAFFATREMPPERWANQAS